MPHPPAATLLSQLRTAQVALQQRLSLVDIDDPVRVRIKPFGRHRDCRLRTAIACYRSFSQFRSGPIVWINDDFLGIARRAGLPRRVVADELLVTLCHEYGHVIAEFLRLRDDFGWEVLCAAYPDEEDFAEDFARFLDSRPTTAGEAFFERVLLRYRSQAFDATYEEFVVHV